MPPTLKKLAELIDGSLAGDPQCLITGIGPIESATEGQITFAEKGRGLKRIDSTGASAVIVPEGFTDSRLNLIQVKNPRVAFAKVLKHFDPSAKQQPRN